MSKTNTAHRTKGNKSETAPHPDSKTRAVAKGTAGAVVVGAATTAEVTINALATFGMAKLGEKIWDWL